jgi:CRISPR/Cas system CSM-associated protein Csm3 (group 7 of RAMP superfamily)
MKPETATSSPYRTLLLVHFEQLTGLSISAGAAPDLGVDDIVFRDGLGRLTIPGTSLTGALVEAAARTGFVHQDATSVPTRRIAEQQLLHGGWITGKLAAGLPQREQLQDEDAVQSLWKVAAAHLDDRTTQPLVQWRQGVGIRHSTGATAATHGALYDSEFIPAGTRWWTIMDLDTWHGGPGIEILALLAWHQLDHGCSVLGRNAARGMGRIKLLQQHSLCVRLPLSREAIVLWPDSSQDWTTHFQQVHSQLMGWRRFTGVEFESLDQAMHKAAARAQAEGSGLKQTRPAWCFLQMEFELGAAPGPAPAADPELGTFGWEGLHVGGHPALALVGELDARGDTHQETQEEQQIEQDQPFVQMLPTSAANSAPHWRPYLPGSGLRGPLRHAASRLQRQDTQVCDPLEVPFDEDGTRRVPSVSRDPITQLFGLQDIDSWLTIEDGCLIPETEARLSIETIDQIAQDEFTAGVYGSAKFDTDVLLSGRFRFRLQLAAKPRDDWQTNEDSAPANVLLEQFQVLRPTLRLAQFGYVPIGGSKSRGCGWAAWQVRTIEFLTADGIAQHHESIAPERASEALSLAEELLERYAIEGVGG